MEQKRYIVTLKSKDDLESFYNDMECETDIPLLPDDVIRQFVTIVGDMVRHYR